MASYQQIRLYIKNTYGTYVKASWIADVKKRCGLPVKRNSRRLDPCPDRHVEKIKSAFKHYDMI